MVTQHILVPLDFSAYADQALEYAMALAKTLQARLLLLHVIHLTPMTMGDMYGYSLEAYVEAMESEAQRHMEGLLNRVHQEGLRERQLSSKACHFKSLLIRLEARI